jgi:hypothetical protein
MDVPHVGAGCEAEEHRVQAAMSAAGVQVEEHLRFAVAIEVDD